MLVSHFFDLVPIELMFVGTILVMVVFIECGFRLGKRAQANAKKAQTSQVRAIMGAGLGLLAFMLAFTFSTAQSHFEARVQNLAEEARIARNAFMQADLLAEPHRTQAKHLLKDYIGIRLELSQAPDHQAVEMLGDAMLQSERIHRELWLLALSNGMQAPESTAGGAQTDALMASVIALTDVHYTRLHAGLMNRIPLTIWITLYLMAILSMIIMGFQAGLTDRRSPVATLTLAVAFTAVIILINDLDRPIMSFFDVNNQLLLDLHEYMQSAMRTEYLPAAR
jgi:NADH:ubiquinone oxidoreductase subunit 6 (subunit J)